MLNLKRTLVARTLAAGLALAGSVAASFAAASLSQSGLEYPIMPALPRDQVAPNLSLNASGGYIVAQDATIDGNGWGIRARRINADLSASQLTFGVNFITEGDQQNAKVAALANGGAAFSWQGSTASGHRIYTRFLDANGRFTGREIPASETAAGHQSDAAIAALQDGSAVVVWAEWERDGNMQGIFGQRFSATGQRLGGTFQVNTVTYLNQRAPAIAALENGGFVVAWVSDEYRQRGSEYIDIAARLFDGQGNALGNDFALNSGQEICANPSLAATAGGFRAAWSSRGLPVRDIISAGTVPQSSGLVGTQLVTQTEGASLNRWDVSTRAFDFQGEAPAPEVVVNSTRAGDQFSPRLVNFQDNQLVLWTSFGQDGSLEGIVGRVIRSSGDFDNGEFTVNTRRALGQIFPTAGTIGDTVLVAWASFLSTSQGFDLVAQQFTVSADQALPKPTTPFAFALGQDRIAVSWAAIGGQEIVAYRIYVDDDSNPIETTEGMLTISRPEWLAGSAHQVRLSYRLGDGRVSPFSDSVLVLTWGPDDNGDSLPDDWQRENWGKETNWPAAIADTDGDGASNLTEFLAGTDPTNPESVLRVEVSSRPQGLYVQWATTPGSYYQLQYTSDFKEWSNVGAARFAPSSSDAVPVTGAGQVQYYRVIRMR